MTPPRSAFLPGDRRLLAVVDAAMAGAARRSGERLACRPGCTECCIGPFPISALDAERLSRGLDRLARADPARADAVAARARRAVALFEPDLPPGSAGALGDERAQDAFLTKHAALPCPALDPATGLCNLYAHRPIACRTFGPPMRIEGTPLPPCRLCFVDAPPAEVEACRTRLDCAAEEGPLEDAARASGFPGETLIAFALVRP